jgi:hypothetical protein
MIYFAISYFNKIYLNITLSSVDCCLKLYLFKMFRSVSSLFFVFYDNVSVYVVMLFLWHRQIVVMPVIESGMFLQIVQI